MRPEADEPPSNIFSEHSAPPFRSQLWILQIEDDEADAQATRRQLRREWPECQTVHIKTLPELSDALVSHRFDIILSDFSLPGFDGLAALDECRHAQPFTPCIFLSGTPGEENVVKALQRGAFDFILKDRPARLIEAIQLALARGTDASRRARAEVELSSQRDWYSQIMENLTDLIAVVDLQGHRLYNSPAYAAFLGDPAKLKGTDGMREIHADDQVRVRLAFEATTRTGRGWQMEYRIVTATGVVHYLESTGNVIRLASGGWKSVLVVSHDITKRRDSEAHIRMQASLLHHARDAIVATDTRQRVTFWNASAERIYAWAAAEVMGRNLSELGLVVDPERFAGAHAQTLATGEWQGDLQFQLRDGRILEIETTLSLVRGNGDDAILIIGTDVTETRKLQQEALRTERMDSIGMLAGGVAHDLNNVLTPILMGTELLRSHPDTPNRKRILDTMERSGRHGASLVRQMLSFARGEDSERIDVSVPRLIDDIQILLGQSLPDNVSLAVGCGPGVGFIHADATQVKQVLLNLCLNARDALPDGGKITVGAETVEVSPAMAAIHPGAAAGPHVSFGVRDDGKGIPPAALVKIFDPFFTTKRPGKGTGLGLATVAGIVRKHGGFITVESRVGQGTSFQLYFPVKPRVVMAGAPPAVPIAVQGNKEEILVIDGNEEVRNTFRLVLEVAGYRVVVSDNPLLAIGGLGLAVPSAEVVILDLRLLGADAQLTIAELRARSPQFAMIITCPVLEPHRLAELVVFNPPIDVLAKPVAAESLLKAVAKALTLRAAAAKPAIS